MTILNLLALLNYRSDGIILLMGTDKEKFMAEDAERRPYTKPEIIHEMDLEIHAGTPLPGAPDPLNPANPITP